MSPASGVARLDIPDGIADGTCFQDASEYILAMTPIVRCQQLQLLVHDAMAKHLYESAVFFADKLVSFGNHSPVDTYTLAQAYFLNKQYRRALHTLKKSELIEQDPRCCYLAALCLAENQCWEECLNILGGWDEEEAFNRLLEVTTIPEQQGEELSLKAAMLLLRGKAYAALDNQQRAVRWLKAALQADPCCYEAFQMLVDNHMLTSKEEFDLVGSLSFESDMQWLQLLYWAKCKKYDQQSTLKATLERLEAPSNDKEISPSDTVMHEATSSPIAAPSQKGALQSSRGGADSAGWVRTRSMAAKSPAIPNPVSPPVSQADSPAETGNGNLGKTGFGLSDNLDVLICRADWLYYLGAYQECFQLTTAILDRDPYAKEAMPLHLTTAVELKHKNELFLQAHRLVQEHADGVIAWFAVACYYLCTRQYEVARRYFGKATGIDPGFAPAWIGFGHAFAFQDESDQAMAAYRTAARLLPGLHVPLVGMGMEYQRMNNIALSEQLYLQAHAICPADPLVCNELGVLAYRVHSYAEAEQWFLRALDRLPHIMTAACEPTLNNLGHVYRKQYRYEEAEQAYLKALSLSPGQATTFAALAFTYHLEGRLQQAILNYHKALGVRPDDSFAKEMLSLAIKEECAEGASEL